MKRNAIVPLMLGLFTFIACEEVVELDEAQTPTKIVVEGIINNVDSVQEINLSETTGFYDEGTPPRVRNADVVVADDAGNSYTFVEDEVFSGRYTANFTGMAGRTYNLEVTLDNGEVFTATDQMPPVQDIDTLIYEVDEDEFEDPEEEGYYYTVKIFGPEPQDRKDYYLFKFYRNEEIERFDSETGLFFADDELLGPYIFGLEAPVFYAEGDTATFEMYAMSRDAYLYYNDLSNVLNGDGGLFGPSPTNPRSNINNANDLGLGFFQASALEREQVIVGE